MLRIRCIAGCSSVGKQSTIRRLLAGDRELARRFDVRGEVRAVGYAFGSLNPCRLEGADTILVQWQVAEHGKLATLRQWFPQADYRAYFLLRDWRAHLLSHRARYLHEAGLTVEQLQARTARLVAGYFADGGSGPVEFVMMPEIAVRPEPLEQETN